jgi:hypothetical protein
MGRWEKTPVGPIEMVETEFANKRCYLSSLGNCSTKISKEHFISRNILEKITSSTLKIENAAHFFGGKSTLKIGIDAFASKVLCDHHNSALSSLDTVAGLAFARIESLTADALRSATARDATRSLYIVSGIDIERWLLKVYCGLVAAKKIRTQSGAILLEDPLQTYLLSSLMGYASLCSPLGLHIHSFPGQQLQSGRISFSTIMLTDGSDQVGGLMLSLGLINFVLITSPKFGETFTEPNWYRHQALAWNVRQGRTRLAFLFTY